MARDVCSHFVTWIGSFTGCRLDAGRGRRSRLRQRRLCSGGVESLDGRVLLSTIMVTSLADSGPGTLRSAIEQANSAPLASNGGQSQTIVFAPSLAGTITLQGALPDITGNENIEGPGPSVITVARSSAAGTPDFGILTTKSDVPGGVTISGLTIEGGDATQFYAGGGILNLGNLDLTDCIVRGNMIATTDGSLGAGICNFGQLTLTNDTVEGNTLVVGGGMGAAGAGIFNATSGVLVLDNSTVNDNVIGGDYSGQFVPMVSGAGIDNFGNVAIFDSTIAGNSISGGGMGGGIENDGYMAVEYSTISGNFVAGGSEGGGQGGGIANMGLLRVLNTTISGNSAGGSTVVGGFDNAGKGGGIINLNAGSVSIVFTTINGNSVGDGVDTTSQSPVTVPGVGGGIDNTNPGNLGLWDSIVAGNTVSGLAKSADVFGGLFPGSTYNLIGDGLGLTGITNGVGGNLVGSSAAPLNPKLGPLASNGGPTPTEALLPGSPAINAGVAVSVPWATSPLITTDQRGLPRFSGSAPDMGAYEVQTPPPKVVRLERFGDRSRTTQLVVSFSEALNPTTASNTANYRLVRVVKNGRGGLRPSHAVPIRLISYNPTSHSVTITPRHRLPLNFVYRLVLNGSSSTGLADPAGNYLDAKSAGAPGRDEFIRFGRGAIVLSSTRV